MINNLSRTDNADNSYRLTSDTYQTNFETSYGMYYGLINKKEYTDEEGNQSQKYSDAAGNLIRDVRIYLNSQGQTDYIFTDYKYDALYRVVQVKTPEGKQIYYTYDGYGRQKRKETPDNGQVKMKYNNDNSVRFSQDNSQFHRDEARPSRYYTFHGYDGQNRMVYSGEIHDLTGSPGFDNLNPMQHYSFENYNEHPDNFLLVNVYDTLSYQAAGIFTAPSDYYDRSNNTAGRLIATAYRTLYSDGWSYKYYRYDARGRCTRMWQVQDGFGQKTFDYEYNSQNAASQMTYQAGSTNTDYRRFYYTYDLAGRTKRVFTDGSGPVPDYLFPVVEYGYNENSQIDTLLYHSGAFLSLSYFNQRNRVTAQESRENKMGYQLDYYLNGNVKSRKVMGNYRLNYPTEQREMNSVYTYDKANRLTNVNRFNVKSYSPIETFSYDKDGNILTLTRDYKGDNFIYQYYSGTNRLKNINGTAMQQYIYDYNGNVTADSVRKITGITYDYRNLPVEMNLTTNNEDRYKYKMRYKYDEAGNRIRKQMYRSSPEEENWTLYNDEVYVRDAKGNETAIYENSNLQYINIWGAGLEGKVRKDDRGNTIYSYYYKDHLGSITAVMDGASGTITQAQDYDAWGDICRTYSTTDTTVDKFTGKERDQETGYDYFGARYYDSRIGRWLQTEPLYDKYLQFSPYQYGLLNPMILKDVDGNRLIFVGNEFERTFALQIIRQGVSSNLREYINSLEIDGTYYLDPYLLEKTPEKYRNQEYYDLLTLAKCDKNININYDYGTDEIKYLDLEGSEQIMTMGIPAEDQSNELFIMGITLFPFGTKQVVRFSLNNDIDIFVNKNILTNPFTYLEEIVMNTSHELYGHALQYIKGNRYYHYYFDDEFDELIKGIMQNSLNNTLMK